MSNYDEKTGISYGVISPNNISQMCLSDLFDSSTDPYYESSKSEFLENIRAVLLDTFLSTDDINDILDLSTDKFNDCFESSGDGIFDYSDKDYTLHNSADNFGLFVIKSPYYTYCRKCSPCAPGAGDLNNPVDMDGAGGKSEPSPYQLFSNQCADKAYCLDKSFFDDYNKIPYRVFRVDNDQEVI